MDFELKQGDVIELENGEHWLYGENVSYRLEDEPPRYWTNAEFDDNMRTKDTHEQVVKVWRYDRFWDFREIVNELGYKTPSWIYEVERFKVGDIIKITFDDGDVDIYIVDDDGELISRKRRRFCDDKFPSYDRIKNSDVVTKVELMELKTVKEL